MAHAVHETHVVAVTRRHADVTGHLQKVMGGCRCVTTSRHERARASYGHGLNHRVSEGVCRSVPVGSQARLLTKRVRRRAHGISHNQRRTTPISARQDALGHTGPILIPL